MKRLAALLMLSAALFVATGCDDYDYLDFGFDFFDTGGYYYEPVYYEETYDYYYEEDYYEDTWYDDWFFWP